MRISIALRLAVLALAIATGGCKVPASHESDPRTPDTSAEKIDTSQSDLQAIRYKAEALVKRCKQERKEKPSELAKCEDLYTDLMAEANAYWDTYKATFVAAALAGELKDDLLQRANKANDAFILLRNEIVPAVEQAQSNPATIVAIIQIARELYRAYAEVKEAERLQVRTRIFSVVDAWKFRDWSDISA